MGRTNRLESPSGFYHVMQRGVGKQLIFEETSDYEKYLNKLMECRECLDFKIIAYCLMRNHSHLLIKTENIKILSKLMSKLGSSYAWYYNEKYDHAGSVFQGRYLSEPICDERYLISCVRYIHNNPVKAGFGERDRYTWSSYNEYFKKGKIAEPEIVLSMFCDIKQFELFSETADDRAFLDIENEAATCAIGRSIVEKYFGNKLDNTTIVKRLCVDERNTIIREMKAAGLNNHQIELVTGVSRAIVRRI